MIWIGTSSTSPYIITYKKCKPICEFGDVISTITASVESFILGIDDGESRNLYCALVYDAQRISLHIEDGFTATDLSKYFFNRRQNLY